MSISSGYGLSSFFPQDFFYYTNAKIAAKEGYLAGIVTQLRESSVPSQQIVSLVSQIAFDCLEEGSLSGLEGSLQLLEEEWEKEGRPLMELILLGKELIEKAVDLTLSEIAYRVATAVKNPFYQLGALQIIRKRRLLAGEQEEAARLSIEMQQLPIPFEEKKQLLLPLAQEELKTQEWKDALSIVEMLLGQNPVDLDCIRLKLQCLLEMNEWKKVPPFALSLCYALRRAPQEGILQLLIHISDLCYEREDKEAAFRILLQVLEIEPHQRCCLYRLIKQHTNDHQEMRKIGKKLCDFLEKESFQKLCDRIDWIYKGLKARIEMGSGYFIANLLQEAWKVQKRADSRYLIFSHLLLVLGKSEEAFTILREIAPQLNNEAEVQEAGAQLLELLRLGVYKADNLYPLISAMGGPWEAKIDVLFKMGQFLFFKGDKEEAKGVFQCILRVNACYNGAAQALALCG